MQSPSFEVQLYKKGRWENHSAHGAQAEAESVAKTLQGDRNAEGVRVTRELFDPETNRFASQVIYRYVRGEAERLEQARETQGKADRADSVVRHARATRQAVEREGAGRRRALPSWFWPLLGVLAALAVIGGLIGLRAFLHPS